MTITRRLLFLAAAALFIGACSPTAIDPNAEGAVSLKVSGMT